MRTTNALKGRQIIYRVGEFIKLSYESNLTVLNFIQKLTAIAAIFIAVSACSDKKSAVKREDQELSSPPIASMKEQELIRIIVNHELKMRKDLCIDLRIGKNLLSDKTLVRRGLDIDPQNEEYWRIVERQSWPIPNQSAARLDHASFPRMTIVHHSSECASRPILSFRRSITSFPYVIINGYIWDCTPRNFAILMKSVNGQWRSIARNNYLTLNSGKACRKPENYFLNHHAYIEKSGER